MSGRKRNICFFLLFASLLLGNGAFYGFIVHKKSELAQLTKNNLQLRERINEIKEEIERERGLLSQGRIARINFFQLHEVPSHEQTSFFLQKIAELSSAKGVKVLQVKLLPQEENLYYTKFLFVLETEAPYAQLLRFIKDIEYTLGLNIETLNIIKSKDQRFPKVKMVLSSIEMKGQTFSKVKVNFSSPSLPRVKRNPFSASVLTTRAKTATSGRKTLFRLHGIMRFKNVYKAMINDQIVKEGDIIKGYKVSFIREDRVILAQDGRYVVLRPGTATIVKRQKILPKEIETFLNFWEKTWENKDLENYMSCYSSQFSHQGMDWKAWRRYKKGLFNRYQRIKLELKDVQFSKQRERVVLSFKQYFQTEQYKDVGLK
ncbi:MAG: hypothetical protein J7M03_06920, partial [Candidatus Desulfofervidaceae bacterium]|nr:hypothetical protein [Candidatus Desulfofervidaceae bacterium]